MTRSRCFLPLFAALATLAAVGETAARADDPQGGSVTFRELDPHTGAALKSEEQSLTYLNLGPMFQLVDAADLTYALGVEGSVMHYQQPKLPTFGYGFFAQAQLQNSKYFRTAVGGEAAYGPVGVELGLGVRQGDATYTSTVSAHMAVFLSIGYLFIAYRFSPQILAIPTNEPGFGFETAFVVGIKVPIVLQGRDPTGWAVQPGGHAW